MFEFKPCPVGNRFCCWYNYLTISPCDKDHPWWTWQKQLRNLRHYTKQIFFLCVFNLPRKNQLKICYPLQPSSYDRNLLMTKKTPCHSSVKAIKMIHQENASKRGWKAIKVLKRKFYVKRSPTETKYACIVTVCFLFWPNAIFLDQRCFHEHVLL